MKVHCLIVLILTLFFVKGESDNKTTTYNAGELLSKIFNFSTPTTARQSNYGLIKFEDDSNLPEDDRPYRLISFEEQSGQSLKFEDDQIDSNPNTHQIFKFDDDEPDGNQNSVFNGNIERPNQALKFEDKQEPKFEQIPHNSGNKQEGFQDDNRIEEQKPLKKKRRRRRRKPRYQGFQQGYPGFPVNVGQGQPPFTYQMYPVNGVPQGVGQSGQYPYQHPGGPAGQFYRPPRRPKPSIASQALSTITGALTSIAQYDDYQCVPRLLCEAAGGGALGSSSVLQNIAGLQPLLTLLAAYNGVSSSPLFIFGRAVFLGMTSKGNLGTCRYGYPQCPTDPEQLVHYLNNYNGGFFRFFNAPNLSNQQNGQQNVQQFYNQLSLPQNYGVQQPNTGLPSVQNYGYPNIQGPPQQNYEFQDPNLYNNDNGQHNYGLNYPYQNNNQQGYGLQNPNNYGPQNYSPNYPYHHSNQQGYGTYGFQNPNLYDNINGYQNYGPSYPYQSKYGFNKIRFKNNNGDVNTNKIEKRIQNNPVKAYIDGNPSYDDNFDIMDHNSNWVFPENNVKHNFNQFRGPENVNTNDRNVRGGKALKFPEENKKKYYVAQSDFNRKEKGIIFPNNNLKYVNYYAPAPNKNYDNNNLESITQNQYKAEDYQNIYNNKLNQNNYHNYLGYNNNQNKYNYQSAVNSNYQNIHNQNNNNDDDELETVYIVRGDGDPNNPEIVKLKPGEVIQ